MSYELFCQSVQGAGHIKHGLPCEDYGIKFENEMCKVFALGDGHGDSNCPRSSYGSRSICEIAVEELQLFAKELKNQNWEEQLFDKYSASQLVNQLVVSIFGKWSCRVNEDFFQNPLTEKEENEASHYVERYKRGERIEHIYGTTFIAGLLTENYLLLLQQGDGRCVVFDCQGDASQPIPWDDRCFANVTTSVCDVDAVQSCRYHIIDLKQNAVIACVAGSDGVEDSFGSMDKMHTYYREKLQIACESGVEELEKHLAETLPSFSATGSQDDVTICGIIDRTLFNGKLRKILADSEAVVIKDYLARANERLGTMAPKLEYLQKKCDTAASLIDQTKQKYFDLENEFKSISADLDVYRQTQSRMLSTTRVLSFSTYSIKCLQRRLDKIKEEKNDISKEVQEALNKKKLCDDEYNEYKQKYDEFVSLKAEYDAKLNAIGSSVPSENVSLDSCDNDFDDSNRNLSSEPVGENTAGIAVDSDSKCHEDTVNNCDVVSTDENKVGESVLTTEEDVENAKTTLSEDFETDISESVTVAEESFESVSEETVENGQVDIAYSEASEVIEPITEDYDRTNSASEPVGTEDLEEKLAKRSLRDRIGDFFS